MVPACSCAGDPGWCGPGSIILLLYAPAFARAGGEGRHDVKELDEAVRRNPTLQACLQMGGKRKGSLQAERRISRLANVPDSGHASDVHSKVLTAIAANLALVGASACHSPKPKVTDEIMRKISLDSPGMTAGCLKAIRFGGIDAMPDRIDQCFAMTKPQRWRGLWLDAFEGQRFCPAPAQSCEDDGKDGHIWITFPNDARPTGKTITARTYAIEFVGRRTLLPGHHGHLGVSAHEIIVDKLISVTPINQ